MSTNFHWLPDDAGLLPPVWGLQNPPVLQTEHIGMRLGAGLYCFDCGSPCVEAVASYSSPTASREYSRWSREAIHGERRVRLDHCPLCHSTDRKIMAKTTRGHRPEGLVLACSFTWAQEPARVLRTCHRWPGSFVASKGGGETFTGADMVDMLTDCPIWFTDLLGSEFS